MGYLSFIGMRPKDANVDLQRVLDNLYILKCQNNPLAFFKKGSVIWVEREDHYDVFELKSDIEYNEKNIQKLLDEVN